MACLQANASQRNGAGLQELERRNCLGLGGGSECALDGKEGQKLHDFAFPHVLRVAELIAFDEATHPSSRTTPPSAG